MSDIDTTRPPAALAAFFELQQWQSLPVVERERLLKVYEIGVREGERVSSGARAQVKRG